MHLSVIMICSGRKDRSPVSDFDDLMFYGKLNKVNR
jgi:hypothetical protein